MSADLTVAGLVAMYRIPDALPSFSGVSRSIIGFVEHVRRLTAPSKSVVESTQIVTAARGALKSLSDELQRYQESQFSNYPFLLRIRNLNHQDSIELFKIISNTKTVASSLVSGSDRSVQDILVEKIKDQNDANAKSLWSGLAALKGVCSLAQAVKSVLRVESFTENMWNYLGRKIDAFVKKMDTQNEEIRASALKELIVAIKGYDFKADLKAIGIAENALPHYTLNYFKDLADLWIESTALDLWSFYKEQALDFNQLTQQNEESRTLSRNINKIQAEVGGMALAYNRQSHGNGAKIAGGSFLRSNCFGHGLKDIPKIGNKSADHERICQHREKFNQDMADNAKSIYSNFFNRSLPEKGTTVVETNDLAFEGANAYGLEEYEYLDDFERASSVVEWLIIYYKKASGLPDQDWESTVRRVNPEIQTALVFAISNQLFSVEELDYVESEHGLIRSEELDRAVTQAKYTESQKKEREESKTP